MRVVDVQVDGGAAGLGGVADVGGPVRPGDDALEVAAEQPAVAGRRERPSAAKANSGTNGSTWATMSSRPALRAACDHGVGVVRSQGDRLLDEDVLAGLQGGDGHLGVQMGRSADVDQVDVGVGEQVVEVFVALDAARGPSCSPGGPKLPRMPRQSPASFFGSRLQMAVTRAAVQVARGEVVDHAHEADAYYPDSHHRRISFAGRGLQCRLIVLVRSNRTNSTDFLAQFLALFGGAILCSNGVVRQAGGHLGNGTTRPR